jgi:hypothetical protein
MVTNTDDAVVLRANRSTAPAIAAALLFLTEPAAVAVVAVGGDGPLDYPPVEMSLLVPIVAVLVLALIVSRDHATRPLVLTADRLGLTPWSDLEGLSVHTGILGRRVRIRRRVNRIPLVLPAPWGWGRPFDRDVAVLREHAARHGVPFPEKVHRGPSPFAAVAFVLAMIAVVGVQADRRGVIWPWQPVATAYPADGCAALDRSGLGATGDAPPVFGDNLGILERLPMCLRSVPDPHGLDGRIQVDVMLTVGHGDMFQSPVGAARDFYRETREFTDSPVELAGIGDGAFRGVRPDQGRGTATRAAAVLANVVVRVDIDGDGGPTDDTPERVLRAILAEVRT